MKTQKTQLKSAGPRSASTSAGLLIGLNTYRAAVLALFFAGASLLGTSAASAATITVINTNDSGPGSLRQALVGANDGDTINFDSSLNGQRITLISGELNVDKDVTISGPGANNLALDGNAQSRVFDVNPGKTVTINGLTVANGRANFFGSGGGIYNNAAALTVTNCTFSGNSATNGGGGIGNSLGGATLTVTNCMFSSNSAVHGGGAIGNLGTLTVTNCTISGNSASFGGGLANRAFDQEAATLTVTNCTISGNISTSAYAGGIGNIADSEGSATLTIANCTISGNSGSNGGGISNVAQNASMATLTTTNSTISGNLASTGGGIYNEAFSASGDATLTITNSTLSGNSASQGGGIRTQGAGATVQIGDAILNAGASGGTIFNNGGTVTSLGYNLASDNGGGLLTGPGDQINTDPLLGPLKDNGGPTNTHAPLTGSPAIDKGKDIGATGQDQRGDVRPVRFDPSIPEPPGGDGSDIGAVELAVGVQPTSAASRKTHGSAGTFDVNLPLSGNVGVECRTGGATNDYQMIVNFAHPVTFSSAAVTEGTGTVASSSGSGTTQVTINLTGVGNAQRLTVGLFDVNDGTHSGDVGVRMGVLVGDVNGNAVVNAADVALTKSQVGMAVSGSNFREDVNANGTITSTDVAVVKSDVGHSLPP